MSELTIKRIGTNQGPLPIDYNSLANLPTTDTTLSVAGQAADAKAVAEALDGMSTKFSNPNLLINSDFRNPINQRGQTSYTATERMYTIDRWSISQGTLTVNEASITFEGNTTANNTSRWFSQRFEHALNGTHRVSFNCPSVTGEVYLVVRNNSDTSKDLYFIITEGYNKFTLNHSMGNFDEIFFRMVTNSKFEIEWIKLEQGAIVTPFVPKSYAQEVSECQRYFNKSNGLRLNAVHGTNDLYITIPLSVTLRHVPTIGIDTEAICVVPHDSGVASRYTIKSYRVDSVANNHLVIDVVGEYGVNTYKSGIIVEDLPIFIDAEIY